MEEENQQIGIVAGVQSYRWERVTIEGVCAHAGTTPWRSRKEALLVASRFIIAATGVVEKNGGVFTCGTMEIEPFSVNVIPDKVSFTPDCRHEQDEIMAKICTLTRKKFVKLIEQNKSGPLKYN